VVIAVNPYHLTTRESPALVSAQLAERVVTLVPAPAGGRAAAARVPSYVELTRSWQWSLPLWRAGVMRHELEGEGPEADMEAVHRTIRRQDEYGCLRVFLEDDRCEEGRGFLSALAADLLKAGPNPGFVIPVSAAVDRFAGRHGAVVMRGEACSVAQHAEAAYGRALFAIVVPLFVQADGQRLLHAREVMEDALVPLRDALEDVSAEFPAPGGAAIGAVEAAAAEYARLFQSRRVELLEDGAADEVVPIDTPVHLAGVVHPADVVLRSSVSAALGRPRGGGRWAAGGDADDGRDVLSLVARPLGVRR
jgi:hypothetical protein